VIHFSELIPTFIATMETNHPDQGQTGKHLKEYEAAWKNCSVEDILSFMAEDVSVSDYGASPFSPH